MAVVTRSSHRTSSSLPHPLLLNRCDSKAPRVYGPDPKSESAGFIHRSPGTEASPVTQEASPLCDSLGSNPSSTPPCMTLSPQSSQLQNGNNNDSFKIDLNNYTVVNILTNSHEAMHQGSVCVLIFFVTGKPETQKVN